MMFHDSGFKTSGFYLNLSFWFLGEALLPYNVKTCRWLWSDYIAPKAFFGRYPSCSFAEPDRISVMKSIGTQHCPPIWDCCVFIAHSPTYVHTRIQAYIHACRNALHTQSACIQYITYSAYIHTYIRTYMHTYIHTHIHTYIHTCIIYIHACMHAYIHR